jgi:hypothetical protein
MVLVVTAYVLRALADSVLAAAPALVILVFLVSIVVVVCRGR